MPGFELVTTWLTPTVLFCILNLTIGTIFVISSLKPNNKNQQKLGDNNLFDPISQFIRSDFAIYSVYQVDPISQFIRVPSLFERVRSMNLSSYRFEQTEPDHHEITQAQEQIKTEPEINEEVNSHMTAGASLMLGQMKKSESEKFVVEKTLSFGGGDDAVDSRADDFISRFRNHLKLQRLDSLVRYKEMLNRGVGR